MILSVNYRLLSNKFKLQHKNIKSITFYVFVLAESGFHTFHKPAQQTIGQH